MKAPFGVGDLVIKVWSDGGLPIGTKAAVLELCRPYDASDSISSDHYGHQAFRHTANYVDQYWHSCACQWRLYEPQKPEQAIHQHPELMTSKGVV